MFCYSSGYRSECYAYEAYLNLCNAGQISPCELAAIKSYRARSGKKRWGIYLKDH